MTAHLAPAALAVTGRGRLAFDRVEHPDNGYPPNWGIGHAHSPRTLIHAMAAQEARRCSAAYLQKRSLWMCYQSYNRQRLPIGSAQESLDSSGVLFHLQRITQVHRVQGRLRNLWMGVQDLIRDETHGFS